MNAIMDVRNAEPQPTQLADELVGRLILSFSEIESTVESCLRQLTGGRLSGPLVDRLVFKPRLDALRDVLALQQGEEPLRFTEFLPLYRRIDRLRSRRNAFVHGRWHAKTARVHLSRRTRGPFAERVERQSNLAMLREELAQLDALALLLQRWYERWLKLVDVATAQPGRMVCNAVANRSMSSVSADETGGGGQVPGMIAARAAQGVPA